MLWVLIRQLLDWECLMITTHLQSNLESLNTDCSFTMANSNSFLSPYEVFLTAHENKYNVFREIFLFYREIVCCVYSLESPHQGNSNEYTQHTIIE